MEASVKVLSFEKGLLVGFDFSFHYNEDAYEKQQVLNIFHNEREGKMKTGWKDAPLGLMEKQDQLTKCEKMIGHMIAPVIIYTAYSALSGQYLLQFYTDVLGLTGTILVWMPLLAKMVSSITGLIFGRLIDRTRTGQGKARPWVLFSGVLLSGLGVLLYCVPPQSDCLRIVWVAVSYNLFFSIALSAYSLSHALMVPLATGNARQREKLAVLSSMATAIISGILIMVAMPLLVRRMGVGEGAQGQWLKVMGTLAAAILPAAFAEYYFTCERVGHSQPKVMISLGRMIRACITSRRWILTALLIFLIQFAGGISNSSMIYYCNWVLSRSVEDGAVVQILVTTLGQAPMGIGAVFLCPAVKRFGRKRISVICFAMAAAGSAGIFLAGEKMPGVLIAMFFRSVGTLPVYLLTAYQAEAMDCAANRLGTRIDGTSAAMMSIVQSAAIGLAQSIVIGGLYAFHYAVPVSVAQHVLQPETLRRFFRLCFAGIPALAYAGCAAAAVMFERSPDNQKAI